MKCRYQRVILLCLAAMLYLLAGCADQSYTATDISEYGVYEGHIDGEGDFESGLFIFPSADTVGMTAEKYFYHCEQAAFDNGYTILLTASYTDDAYTAEVTRLSNLSAEYEGREQVILKADSGFSYPAYVAAFTSEIREYALLDENVHRIVYIYNRHYSILKPEEDTPKEYLPLDYTVPAEYLDKDLGGYSMYHFTESILGSKSWHVVEERG